MWKLFHYEFCLIHLSVGVLIRLVFAERVRPASLGEASVYAIASSAVSALVSTWFPIVPILGGAILIFIAGHSAGESILISAPIIAVSLGIETAVLDAMLFRLLLKGPVRGQFVAFLITNTLNAIIALALGLAWGFHHMPNFIAALRM